MSVHKEDSKHYSEPVQEIMGSVPSWITRWGITLICLVFAVLVIGCCIIRCPQSINASISITSTFPPSELTSRYDGLIDSICVHDGQYVRIGDLIALLSTPAEYNDIMLLNQHLAFSDTASLREVVFDRELKLGALQGSWSLLQKSIRDYEHYIESDYISVRKTLLSQQILSQREYCAVLRGQKQILDKELEIEQADFERDSVLYSADVISHAEYKSSQKTLLSKQGSVVGFEASLESAGLSLLQLEQQVVELDLQRTDEIASYESAINQQIYDLKSQVATWLDTYTIVSPMDGVVSLQNYWSRGQHVCIGDVIANIVPEDTSDITGRMKVSSLRFGDVSVGQPVNVKLNGFPYMEYGMLKGCVSAIASVPECLDDGSISYSVVVSFPNGLESTYHRQFPLIQQMDGSAQIIIKDRSLMSQMLDPIVSLFQNR